MVPIETIMQYEQGELGQADTVRMFAELVRTDLAWKLQGHYGRTAAAMIRAGTLSQHGKILVELQPDGPRRAPREPRVRKPKLTTFYVTSAENMPSGAGYFEVRAQSQKHARELATAFCPDGRWSFLYKSLEDLHPLDRKKLGTIGPDGVQ